MTLEYYGSGSYLTQFIDKIQDVVIDSSKRIGVINWWWLNAEEADLNKLKAFVEQQDICFFLSEEILYRHEDSGINVNNVVALLNQYNVYYILFAEDNSLSVKPAEQRTFYYPWFFKSPLYVSSSFEPDLVYREKQYVFNLLLGSKKSYRTLSYKLLENNNNIYRSYLGHPKFKEQSMTFLEDEDILLDLINQDINVNKLYTMNAVQRDGAKRTISHVVPEKIYANTHFDVVTETFVKQHHHFFTEKTAKPLATGRFFCWYTTAGAVSHLERYGFAFDNNYDLILYDSMENGVDRLNEVLDFIDEVSSNENYVKEIYKKTESNRKHNMDVYWDGRAKFNADISEWMLACINKYD